MNTQAGQRCIHGRPMDVLCSDCLLEIDCARYAEENERMKGFALIVANLIRTDEYESVFSDQGIYGPERNTEATLDTLIMQAREMLAKKRNTPKGY